MFHELSRKWLPLPEIIKRVTFRFGDDSDGSPAVWITIVTDGNINPSRAKIEQLHRAAEAFRADVRNSDTDRWPYIDIKTE